MGTYRDFFRDTSNSRAVVVDESIGQRIGFAYTFNTDLSNGRTSIAFVCDPMHQGSGLFYRGIWLFVDYLFDAFPFTNIYGQSLEFNFEQFESDGARRLNLDDLFRIEGVIKEHEYLAGRWWDEYLIAMSKQDWMRRRQEIRDWLESDHRIMQDGGTVEMRHGSGANRGVAKDLFSNSMMETDSEWVPRMFASPRNRASVTVRGAPRSGPIDDRQIEHILWNGVLVQFVIEDAANEFPLGVITAYGVDWGRQTISIHAVLEELGVYDDIAVPSGICQFIQYLFYTFPLRKLYLQYPEGDETLAIVWSAVVNHRVGAIEREAVLPGWVRAEGGNNRDLVIAAIEREAWES
jgi:hypothetical protein